MTDIEIKGCPFCGEPPDVEWWNGGGPDKHRIGCSAQTYDECGASASATGETLAEAAERWNRRA